jgi:hypothetical protein
MFSLRNKENLPPFKAPLKSEGDPYAVHVNPSYGPILGYSHDLLIYDNAVSNANSYSNFGNSYQPPSSVSSPHTILAGTNYFTPSEIEVFYRL